MGTGQTNLIEDPEAAMRRGLDRPVKISHQTVLVETVLDLGGGCQRVALKRYRAKNWRKALLDCFRRSRARRDWRLAQRLVACGVATARPLLFLEPRERGLFRPSYLATQWIAGSENVHLFGWKIAARPLCERLRLAGACAASLGQLAGRRHARGIIHRDLKAANLLVVAKGGDQVETYLVDVTGARFRRRISRRRRAADLARLAVALEAHPWITRSICRRLMRSYLAEQPPGTADWKMLWREIAEQRRRLIRKMLARGEPVL